MLPIEKIRAKYQEISSAATNRLSNMFVELSSYLKNESTSGDIQNKLDDIFKNWMSVNQSITSEFNKTIEILCEKEESIKRLEDEKKRLEVLYVSGIVFTTINGIKPLIVKALDTVVKELQADEGFIVLTDKDGNINHTFSKNMDPEKDPDAKKMSTSVIRQSLKSQQPVNLDKDATNLDLFKANSVINLGIKSALCVPLLNGQQLLGAVYLDRKSNDMAFHASDLTFLTAFSRQIVQGMDISQEIENLEHKLIDESNLKFEDLRKTFHCSEIIGSSRKLFDVLKIASKISSTDASLVILGESGTGKELLACAVHENSRRAHKPFVAINCSAIPKDLLESELFGYESGAFTGATKSKPGKFELANGGTIFLDEIGEMPINLQVKLLRILQTQELEKLGSVQPVKLDIRILSATNIDLPNAIKEGIFREDLYYRLKVVQLILPSLKERKEDIEELTRYFLSKHAQDNKVFEIDEEALVILENYNWPGNVRELENVILRGTVLAKNQKITVDDLPEELHQNAVETPIVDGSSLADAEANFRKMFILRTLRQTASKAEAAKALGINRTHFYRILAQLGIE